MEQVFEVSLYRPKPTDLEAFLPFACRQLEAPFQLRVLPETVEEYASQAAADDKGKKSKRDKTPQAETSGQQPSVEREPSAAEGAPAEEGEVVVRARCDPAGQPVELLLHRTAALPRLLLKILGLCVPHLERLARLAVRWTPLDPAALHELAALLPRSQLAEISLDDSPAPHRTYHLLLEPPSRLRVLSLARCGLADDECAALAARLTHPLPAARSLVVLSLEGNRIGDAGARALGDALRTNRTLRHLNLAGNSITSPGAAHILRSLRRFPVSTDELVSERRRTFDYLKLRREAVASRYRKLTEASEPAADAVRGRSPRALISNAALPAAAGSGADALASRAATLAAEPVGARRGPFDPAELVAGGGVTYCVGNFTLSYLNLAYNELDCTSARGLADVLAYQAAARATGRRGERVGLLRAVLEGNALAACEATRLAEGLLERSLAEAAEAASARGAGGALLLAKPGRKSERPKFK